MPALIKSNARTLPVVKNKWKEPMLQQPAEAAEKGK